MLRDFLWKKDGFGGGNGLSTRLDDMLESSKSHSSIVSQRSSSGERYVWSEDGSAEASFLDFSGVSGLLIEEVVPGDRL